VIHYHPLAVSVLWIAFVAGAAASGLDEFKVKREQVFEFAVKPSIARKGDNVTIKFTSKALCDVTVAVENSAGKIVRHLASGVLGHNAPALAVIRSWPSGSARLAKARRPHLQARTVLAALT
jgi:hypothetical protein